MLAQNEISQNQCRPAIRDACITSEKFGSPCRGNFLVPGSINHRRANIIRVSYVGYSVILEFGAFRFPRETACNFPCRGSLIFAAVVTRGTRVCERAL